MVTVLGVTDLYFFCLKNNYVSWQQCWLFWQQGIYLLNNLEHWKTMKSAIWKVFVNSFSWKQQHWICLFYSHLMAIMCSAKVILLITKIPWIVHKALFWKFWRKVKYFFIWNYLKVMPNHWKILRTSLVIYVALKLEIRFQNVFISNLKSYLSKSKNCSLFVSYIIASK